MGNRLAERLLGYWLILHPLVVALKERLVLWLSAHRRGLLAGVFIVVTLLAWRWYHRRPEAVVAFVGRNTPSVQVKGGNGDEMFERALQETLQDLVDEWNKDGKNPYRFRLLRQAPTLPDGSWPSLEERYKKLLETEPNLVAVFDNHWGDEIIPFQAAMKKFPVPIVFLNADHNAGIAGTPDVEHPYGDARFFVGNSDSVPLEVGPLLSQLFNRKSQTNPDKQDPPQPEDLLFATENSYHLTERFDQMWSKEAIKPSKRIDLQTNPSQAFSLPAGASVAVHNEISSDFLRGTTEEKMQARHKVLVLNSHGEWGEDLLTWLDGRFKNLTVVTYQASLSAIRKHNRGKPDYVFGRREPSNQMILLSLDPQTISDQLVVRYRRLKTKYPEVFSNQDAPFFLRRCVIAMELCSEALRKIGGNNGRGFFDGRTVIRDHLEDGWESFRSNLLRSVSGQYYFDKYGALIGQNRFLLHQQGIVSDYTYQPNYHAQLASTSGSKLAPSSAALVRNAQVGLQDIKVSDINVESKTFHAEFFYSMRVPEPGSESPQPTAGSVPNPAPSPSPSPSPKRDQSIDHPSQRSLRLVNFKPDALGGEDASGSQRLVAEYTFGSLHEFVYHVSGTFRIPQDMQSRSDYIKNNSNLFPFDQHRLKIELQAQRSDQEIRLSKEARNLEPLAAGERTGGFKETRLNKKPQKVDPLGEGSAPEVDGWRVTDSYIGVNTRETNSVPVPFEEQAGASLQYDTVVATFSVRRPFWSALPLIWAPVFLLMFASLAVLFITFGGDDSAGPEGEALKSQTELSLGCTLAVITYLISYSTFVPRLSAPNYADLLVGFSLLFSTVNFIFVVAISKRTSTPFWRSFQLRSYRRIARMVFVVTVLGWLLAGWLMQHLF